MKLKWIRVKQSQSQSNIVWILQDVDCGAVCPNKAFIRKTGYCEIWIEGGEGISRWQGLRPNTTDIEEIKALCLAEYRLQ